MRSRIHEQQPQVLPLHFVQGQDDKFRSRPGRKGRAEDGPPALLLISGYRSFDVELSL